MNLEEIQAVIDSAKARGTDQLATYVRARLPGRVRRGCP